MNRIIVHVDMDAFYASIEQLDCPDYCGKPVVVGADPVNGKGRGVVSAASYEARKYGIHSAMPISQAYKLCKDAFYVRPRFKRYSEISKKVMKVLSEFSPVIEQISIDEAFLDCSGTKKLFETPYNLGISIKNRIKQETYLKASVGIASNKSIAKIASDLEKPDGLVICPEGKEREFLWPLETRYLWGAGKKTIEKLKALGYLKIGDIAKSSKSEFEKLFGKWGVQLWDLSNGIDERPVSDYSIRKSISEEITFNKDIAEDSYIEYMIFEISDRLSRKMRGLKIKGKTVTLKIRLQGFETYTRSYTLKDSISDMKTLRLSALKLYRDFGRKGKKVRLIGIKVSNLDMVQSKTEQLELFDNKELAIDKEADTELLLDDMKLIYGDKITRAELLPNYFKDEKID